MNSLISNKISDKHDRGALSFLHRFCKWRMHKRLSRWMRVFDFTEKQKSELEEIFELLRAGRTSLFRQRYSLIGSFKDLLHDPDSIEKQLIEQSDQVLGDTRERLEELINKVAQFSRKLSSDQRLAINRSNFFQSGCQRGVFFTP